MPAALAPVDVPSVDGPDVAEGLIVKTTTSEPSAGLLKAADRAAGDDVSVADDSELSDGVTRIDFDSAVPAADAEAAADAVAERSDVEWAVPNRRVYTQGAAPVQPNDPGFTMQRNLWNTTSSPYGGYSIKAPSLWRATLGSSSNAAVVAVIDTGILPQHPDILGKTVAGYDMISSRVEARDGNGRDGDPKDEGDWYEAWDCGTKYKSDSSWHGTFVAGQIAAATDNGIGIAGVAPNVKVQPIRALGRCGGTYADIVASMEWASGGSVSGAGANATPAKIVNMSLASPPLSASARNQDCEMYSYYAARGSSRGSIFIAAAGNDQANANRVTPASCSGFISVGATSVRGFKASYSNYGSTVDISAPGGDTRVDPVPIGAKPDVIWSLGDKGLKGATEYTYYGQQGTSMAAPQVAGAAALLYSLGFTTPSSLTNALYASVTPFRAYSKSYSKKTVAGDRMDLNCRASGRKWCGRGILDLSRVQAPLSKPVIKGTVTVGEPLRTTLGTWVRTPSPKYTWKVGGVTKGNSSVYWPALADVGKTISVTVSPTTSAFARLGNVSVATGAVPVAPQVTLATQRSPRFGADYTASVKVAGATSGQVAIRNDSNVVVGTGQISNGVASVRVQGKKLKPGTHALRASYLGNGVTPKASSPRVSVKIRKLSVKVSTKLAKSVSKNKRAKLRITVSERPNLFASPTGSIRVYDGKKRLMTVKLSSNGRGKKSVRLPKLKKGSHKIRVKYSGNAYIGAKTSSYRTIKSK